MEEKRDSKKPSEKKTGGKSGPYKGRADSNKSDFKGGNRSVRSSFKPRNKDSEGEKAFKKPYSKSGSDSKENSDRPYKKSNRRDIGNKDGEFSHRNKSNFNRNRDGEGKGKFKRDFNDRPKRRDFEQRDDRPRFGDSKPFNRERSYDRDSREERGFGRGNKSSNFRGEDRRERGENRDGGRYNRRSFDRGDRPRNRQGDNLETRESFSGDNPYRGDRNSNFKRNDRRDSGYGRDAGKFNRRGHDKDENSFRRNESEPRKEQDNKSKKPKKLKRERIETRETQSKFGYKGSRTEFEQYGKMLKKGTELLSTEVRLNRYISNSGICSRREADEMILSGRVMVNGNVVNVLGSKVGKKDKIKVDGKLIVPEKPVYIVLNKPRGYITTTDDEKDRKTVLDLIDLPGKERIYPVGRLDRNTSGVLLLTNDGDLTQKLTHPSFEIKKIYRAKLDRKPSKEHMLAWVNGVELEDGWMSFEQIGFVDENDSTVLGLEIHSGRNRIVRRMFEQFKYEVEGLDRVLIGEFDKIKLGRGKWRFLTDKEIGYIDRLKRMEPKERPDEPRPGIANFNDSDWE